MHKLSLWSNFFHGLSAAEALREIRKAGFRYTELSDNHFKELIKHPGWKDKPGATPVKIEAELGKTRLLKLSMIYSEKATRKEIARLEKCEWASREVRAEMRLECGNAERRDRWLQEAG